MNDPQPIQNNPATEIIPLFDQLPFNPGITPAERINFWHRSFQFNLGIALAAGLRAGHELCIVRESIGNRGFSEWCEKNLEFSRRHAYNYISAFEQTVEKHRLALPSPVPLSAPLTEEEVRTVAAEFGATTFRGLQKALSSPTNWGGKRPGAGRPQKDVAAEIMEIESDARVLFEHAAEHLDALRAFVAEEKHLKLDDERLGLLAAGLKETADAVLAALTARVKYAGGAR